MNNSVFISIILVFMFFFVHSFFNTYKENFDKQNYIILIGDSILENSNYVEKYFSVESSIKKTHPNVINLAQDNAIIEEIPTQIKILQQKKINKDDIVFISVGGNNILNSYRFRKKKNKKFLNSIFQKYTKTILNIKNYIPNKLVLLNIYSPPNVKEFHNLIKIWNKKQQKFASTNNFKVLDINKLMTNKKYFVKNIEPSNDGGRIIANAIIDSL